MILFVQPFGLSSHGGGSRILRALLKNAPRPWLSIAATSQPTPPPPFGEELQLCCRPYFGRVERSRFARLPRYLDGWAVGRLETRIRRLIKERRIRAVHAIAHLGWDTLAAFHAAQYDHLPFFLAVHDDPVYCLSGHPLRKKLLAGLAACWRGAAARFVISEEMGQELCSRWGQMNYLLVTDGLERVAAQPRPSATNRLSVYFMGMMHISYEPNFLALQKALRLIADSHPDIEVSLILRCGGIRREAVVHPELIRVLPYGSEGDVQKDMEKADVLYQPISLDPEHYAMSAYSLSTKMITYLGSGLPILFHGPADSASGKLLARNNAAVVSNSLETVSVAKAVQATLSSKKDENVRNALQLAGTQFNLDNIRGRFWTAFTLANCESPTN